MSTLYTDASINSELLTVHFMMTIVRVWMDVDFVDMSRCLVLWSAISYLFFFFFSSRRRHTRCSRDWSSDVCSSDLLHVHATHAAHVGHAVAVAAALLLFHQLRNHRVGGEHQTGYGRGVLQRRARRSEERRVGKECRSRWSPYH